MLPKMQIGAICIMEDTTFDELSVGDVAVYNGELGKHIVHRIIAKHEIENGDINGYKEYFEFKGDNNGSSDMTMVTPDLIEGKIVLTINAVAPIFSYFINKGTLDMTVYQVLLVVLLLITFFIIDITLVIISRIIGIVISNKDRGVEIAGDTKGIVNCAVGTDSD